VPLAVIGVGSAVAVAASTRRRGRVRSRLLAAPTGALFGLGSALTKSVVDAFDDPATAVPELVTSWETYALGVALAAGFWLQQSAYQAGNLKEALPAMITLDPVVSVAIGIVVLHERLQLVDALGWVVVATTLAVMVVGTIQLSRSSALHDPPIT
jgi:drug/metabolite transporter (DMT)-like permease